MTRALLGFAASAAFVAMSILPAAPAAALDRDGVRISSGSRPGGLGFCGGGRHRGGDRCRTDVVMGIYGGDWALYNNRSWEADSYNDWWHDRPDRAFPRWVQHNEGCAPDRMWWSGGRWHC